MYARLRCGGNLPLCERTRYQKQASTVQNMRAVQKTASSGTRRVFGGTRCKKQASGVPNGNSVLKKASWCTRRIFSARNGPRSDVSRHKKRVTSKSIKTFWSQK